MCCVQRVKLKLCFGGNCALEKLSIMMMMVMMMMMMMMMMIIIINVINIILLTGAVPQSLQINSKRRRAERF